MDRVTPTICPHCSEAKRSPRYVFDPPAWVKMLFVLRSGIKGDRSGTAKTLEQIMEALDLNERASSALITEAIEHGALFHETNGHEVRYRRTAYGKLLVQAWIRAGWTPNNKPVNQRRARK